MKSVPGWIQTHDATGTLNVAYATKGSNEGEEKAVLVYLSVSRAGDSPSGVFSKKSFTSLTQPDH